MIGKNYASNNKSFACTRQLKELPFILVMGLLARCSISACIWTFDGPYGFQHQQLSTLAVWTVQR